MVAPFPLEWSDSPRDRPQLLKKKTKNKTAAVYFQKMLNNRRMMHRNVSPTKAP